MKFKLAAYGTLRTGEIRFDIIKQYNPINSTLKKIRGFRMFDLGEYPGVIRTNDKNDEIVVEVFEFSMNKENVKELINVLDAIEGVNYGYYKREVINIDNDNVIIYVLTDDFYNELKLKLLGNNIITDWYSRR